MSGDDLHIPSRLVPGGRPPPRPGEGNFRWWLRTQLARPWPLSEAFIATELVLREGALEREPQAVEALRMALERGLILDDLPELDEARSALHVPLSPTSVAETLDAKHPGWRDLVVRVEGH